MPFDIRTMIMITAALTLLIGISLRYVLRDYPAVLWPSMRQWMLGTLLQPTGWVLFGARDVIPDFFTIVVANTLLSFAFAKLLQAVHLFGQRPLRPGRAYAPVVAIALLTIVFTYGVESIRWRGVTVSLVIALQLLGAIGALVEWGGNRRSHLLTAAAFAMLGVALIVRAVFQAVHPLPLTHGLASTPMQSAIFALAAIFPTIATLGFVLMCSDRLHQELERQATIDSLTGISNRRTLEQQAARLIATALRHKRELAVLLIDADHFKYINDVYGHAAGDEALQAISRTLERELRSEDLLGRLGGEEFVAILPETGEAAACASAERLRAAVERLEFVAQHRHTPLRVSVGVAVIEADDDFSSLLKRADQAMYSAKHQGRNRVVGPTDVAARRTAAALTG